MGTLHMPFGDSELVAQVGDRRIAAVVAPRAVQQQAEESVLRDALRQPVGSVPLGEMARPGQEVVIVTSDVTRPCPSQELLPLVLEELEKAGVRPEDVTVVVALGLHRPMTRAELADTVGADVYGRVEVVNHDVEDTVRVGMTAAGTPVEILRSVVEADLLICLGNIDLHWFVGFTGGAKAVLPGCASEAAVSANHAMMVDSRAAAGCLGGNPVRADIEEAGELVGIDFILNVVVDGEHTIVGAVAGDAVAAHRAGAALVAERSIVPLAERAEVVLVSAGGYPKDINLYQAQKALDNAHYAVKPGGVVILVAECSEGFGNTTFESWMMEGVSPATILERIERRFVLGGHKAAGFARVMTMSEVYLVSTLPAGVVGRCGLKPFSSLDEAIDAAFGAAGDVARMVVMPEGGSTLPSVG